MANAVITEKKERLSKRIWKGFWRTFYNSGTVLLQSFTALSGVVIGGAAAMNAAPLVALVGSSSGFTKNQLYVMGGILFVQGLAGVLVRLNNTKTVGDRLIPKSSEEVSVIAKVKDA